MRTQHLDQLPNGAYFVFPEQIDDLTQRDKGQPLPIYRKLYPVGIKPETGQIPASWNGTLCFFSSHALVVPCEI